MLRENWDHSVVIDSRGAQLFSFPSDLSTDWSEESRVDRYLHGKGTGNRSWTTLRLLFASIAWADFVAATIIRIHEDDIWKHFQKNVHNCTFWDKSLGASQLSTTQTMWVVKHSRIWIYWAIGENLKGFGHLSLVFEHDQVEKTVPGVWFPKFSK